MGNFSRYIYIIYNFNTYISDIMWPPYPKPPSFRTFKRKKTKDVVHLLGLIGLLKSHLGHFIMTLILSLISTIIGLIPPYISKEITDRVLIPRGDFNLLIYLVRSTNNVSPGKFGNFCFKRLYGISSQ